MELTLTHSTKEEDNDRKRGFILSILTHLLVLIIFLIPFIGFPFPQPELQGVLVTFGQLDQGSGDNDLNEATPATSKEPIDNSTPAKKEIKKPVSPPKEVTKKATIKEAQLQSKNTIDDASVISAADKKRNEEARKKAEANRAKQQQLEKEKAKEQALKEAAAQKKREAEAKKKQFGDVFGSSKGKTTENGEQGNPGGSPDAKALEGLVDATGEVGTGLNDRGVVFEPTIIEKSQKTGRVVVEICINSKGEVISADYTQKGSSTTDSELVAVAIKNAKKYRFGNKEVDKQCGNISIDFKLK